jgi:TPR repeat protein
MTIEDVIATRRLKMTNEEGETRSMEIRIGRPTLASGAIDHRCEYQIVGFRTGNPKCASGSDSMEALQNAMAALDAELSIISCDFELRWDERLYGDIGFKRIPALEAIWKAWFISCNYQTGAESARPLAETGIAFAEMILGFAYWLGWGVEHDMAKAVEWLTKAAGQGEPTACDVLAGIYYGGWPGHPANEELARHYQDRARYYGFPQ